jgi:8-oxo-dGTP diphosphatase
VTPLASSPQASRRVNVRVGVGAVVVNEAGQILLIRRGPGARNEQGLWATPGGALICSETLEEAVRREVGEECGIEIAVLCQLGAFDHRLPDGERWVSIAYLAQVVAGSPSVREPEKCSACSWFTLDALPTPLSPLARMHLAAACATLPRDSVWPSTASRPRWLSQ